MFGLILGLAFAEGPVLWWTEEGITRSSALFGRAQARDAKAYEAAQKQLDTARRAAGELELADALLAADAARATYVEATDRALSGQFLRLQKHTDLLGEDYSRTFGAAVERAIPLVAKGATVTECTKITKVEAMMGKSPRCDGTDISARIAGMIDEDKVLQGQVADLLSVEWPAITLTGTPQPPTALTGVERTVDVATLARALRGDALKELDEVREADIEQITADLDSTDPSVKRAAIQKGEVVRDTWRKGVAEVGVKLWPEVKKRLEKAAKKGGPAAVALCANPASLGGCGLPDVTAEVLPLFEAR